MNHDKSIDNIYKLDGKVPVGKAIPFGLQHILAMFVANIAPILIVAGACGLSAAQTTNLVQCAMMIAGVGSLIQLFPLWKIGSGLPIVMGISFTFVSIFCVIGPEYGYGSVVGYIVAACMGIVDFSALKECGVIAIPRFMPFTPEFHVGPIVTVILIFLVSATETIGDTSALAASALNREVTDKEITGSIACDGYISSLSALFGCLPITSFSQNVGLIAMTKVINRFTIATGAGIMILAGLFPIFGALLNTLPEAVLGGCTIIMFGNIVISGLQMISNCGFSQRNITIAALSLSVGIGFTQVPEIFSIFPDVVQNVFADNCVATVFLIAIIANLVLPKEKE